MAKLNRVLKLAHKALEGMTRRRGKRKAASVEGGKQAKTKTTTEFIREFVGLEAGG